MVLNGFRGLNTNYSKLNSDIGYIQRTHPYNIASDTDYYSLMETRKGNNLYRTQLDVDGIFRKYVSTNSGNTWEGVELIDNQTLSGMLGGLKYIAGCCTLSYQSVAQLGYGFKLLEPNKNVISVIASINYTSASVHTALDVKQILTDLETLKSTGYLNIYAYPRDGVSFIEENAIGVSWIVAYTD